MAMEVLATVPFTILCGRSRTALSDSNGRRGGISDAVVGGSLIVRRRETSGKYILLGGGDRA